MACRLVNAMVVGAALVAASFVLGPDASADVASTGLRKPAPNFTLHDSKGAAVKLSDYKGKVLVLDFWATWCTGCKEEIPWFMEFQKKYGSRGLSSLGVAMDEEGWQAVTPYIRQHPFNYPIVTGDEAFARIFPITALPVTLLIDRNGRVADSHVGVVDKNGWEQEIRTLLQERPTK